MFFEQPFDALLESHSGAGASAAGSAEPDLYRIIVICADQLDVSAVALQIWPDSFYHVFDFFFKALLSVSFTAPTFLTHKILLWISYSTIIAAIFP
jgi:hypothetical protein